MTQVSPDSETISTASEATEHAQHSPGWGLSFCFPRSRKRKQDVNTEHRRSSISFKGSLFKLFGIQWPAQPQTNSRFFSLLPLEVRFEIYAYIFASSMINERTKDTLSTWDHLLLSCRQAKQEMESMPIQPIISAVEINWRDRFPNHPLRITFTVKDGKLHELRVALPRTVLGYAYRHRIKEYIPDYISPLFRIFADTLTLTIYDDGSPLIDVRRIPIHNRIFSQILSTIWARERKLLLLGKKYFTHPLPLPTSRNYFNAKKVVVNWEGSLTGLHHEHIAVYFWLKAQWILSKPFRMKLHLGNRNFVFEWVDKKHFLIQGVSWESRTRFRK